MKRKRTKMIRLPFSSVELNIAESPYHLEPDQAVILKNMDFDDKRGSLVGRYGTTTVNPDGILLHGGTTDYLQFYDLFRVEDVSNGNQYILGAYDNGATYHLAYLRTNNTAQTQAITLKLVGGGEFYLTRGSRLTFCSVKCPTNGDIVMGFNGTDRPFYISLAPTTSAITQTILKSMTAATFTGSGLNDMTRQGTFNGVSDANYRVQIDRIGTPDTFRWSDDNGATWKSVYKNITGSAQDLNNDVTVTFGAVTGHTKNNRWDWAATIDSGLDDLTLAGTYTYSATVSYAVKISTVAAQDKFKVSLDGGTTYEVTEYNCSTTGVSIGNGLTITCGAITGHTLDDVWTWTAKPQGVTPFAFGGADNDFKVKFVYERPWKGHAWAAFRTAERNTIHWSATDDYTSFVTASSSGFLQAPPNRPDNPFRGMKVVNDRMIIFNLNSIGEVYYTGNTDDPFKYRELKNRNGTFHIKTVQDHDRGLIFIDRFAPYLKLFNGSQIETMDPTSSVEKSLEKWLDASVTELVKIRTAISKSNLLVSFKSQAANTATGSDGNRWTAVINTTRRDANGVLYYPFNLWNIRSNDIIVGDEGTDFGQVWYSDPDAQTVSGDSRYYIRRQLDWFDVRAGGVGFGDKRGTAADPTDVAYQFRTGWLNLGTLLWKEFFTFRLHGEWEGTPTSGAKLYVMYRCEGWSSWAQLDITAVALYKDPIPFPQTAQGKLIQFEFLYTDKASRPILNHIELEVMLKKGVI